VPSRPPAGIALPSPASKSLQEQKGAGPESLRAFIHLLDEAGCLVRVKEKVHWQFDIGRITRASHSPLLFENIQDYPGQTVFTNGLCSAETIGLAIGLDRGASWKTLVKEARNRLRVRLQPSIVNKGPVLERVFEQNSIDLLSLPVPHWETREAGRYIGTWHLNVTVDPETGERNVGVYRMQLLDQRRATVSTSAASHLSRHFAKAERLGRPLPMAVAIGVPEAVMIAASAGTAEQIDEYELAGALQQKPLDLIQCSAPGLAVPAQSEIVIEGVLQPGVRAQDGPYFDYTGKLSTSPRAYVFEATRLLHRDQPIFRGAAIGVPHAEDLQLFSLLAPLGLLDFHGSRLRHRVQNMCLRWRLLHMFQIMGTLGHSFSRSHRPGSPQ